MSQEKSRGYGRYYRQEDVPAKSELGKDWAILYEMPSKPLTYNNLKGLNFQAVSKETFSHSICFYEDAIESLRRELASEKVKNNLLTARLVDHNISSSLTPEEIQEYGSNLGVILKQEIDALMKERPKNLADDLRERIKAQMMLVDEELKDSFSYNAVLLTESIKRLEEMEAQIMEAPKSMQLKDKASSLDKITKRKADTIGELRELYNAMGMSIKDLARDSSNVAQNSSGGSTGGFDLASLIKG